MESLGCNHGKQACREPCTQPLGGLGDRLILEEPGSKVHEGRPWTSSSLQCRMTGISFKRSQGLDVVVDAHFD